jgi:hypothetical protein
VHNGQLNSCWDQKVSPLVNVLVFVPLSIGLLLWFCFPPGRGADAQRASRQSASADPAASEQ